MTTIELDAYVIDTLLPDLVGHDRHPSAFLLYLHLWRRSEGGEVATEPLPLETLAEDTGLSKRAVQQALEALARRRLLQLERATPLSPARLKVLRPWRARRARLAGES